MQTTPSREGRGPNSQRGVVINKIWFRAVCMLLTFWASGAEPQAKAVKIAAVSTFVAEPQAKPAKAAKAAHAKKAPASRDEGDSRLNDYRLERESCCGPQ